MQVKVVRYMPSARQRVQAFVDLQIGPYRVNGIHLERAGTLRSAQLTPTLRGQIRFIPSIEILDRALEERLTKEIHQAIHDHIETLPMDQRVIPPRPPEPRKPDERPAAVAAKVPNAPVQAKPAPTALPAVSTKPAAKKPKLLPPLRLLANLPRRSL